MEQRYEKLSDYARKNSLTYKTAHNYWVKGLLKGKQLPTGTILIEVEDTNLVEYGDEVLVATYARVSSSENKDNLKSQCERLRNYCMAKGYKIVKEVKEVGSGLNDNRKMLLDLLLDDTIQIIVVEHKDRFSRFGLNYIKQLLEKNNRTILVINEASGDEKDLMDDFVSIITSFCARLYGKRRTKRKTEKIINELNNNND